MTRDELIAVIEEEANQLDAWAEQSRRGGWSTHQVDPMRKRADELRRFAASAKRPTESPRAGGGAWGGV